MAEPPLFGGRGRNADDYATGTRSAIAGGTTTVLTFAPQTRDESSLLPTLDATAARAAADGPYCDYGFHLIVSNPTRTVLDEFSVLRERGVSSIKVYMTYKALQLRDGEMLDVLLRARETGITTMVHAENGDVLEWMTARLEERRLLEPHHHATSRPQLLETEATGRVITLSRLIDTPILIVHVSSPTAASAIRAAQTAGHPVYAETCPQYLFLTREDLAQPGFEGAKCICSPPPRDAPADTAGIWAGLANGTFTILSSDHCPFRYDDSNVGKKVALTPDAPDTGRFSLVPNGLPGVETRLPLIMSENERLNKLGIERFVELTSTNPAKLYGLYPRKGALIPGISDADLVIWYPPSGSASASRVQGQPPFTLTNDMLHHNCDYTPFEGRKLTQWPRYTLLRGKVVWDLDGGEIVGERGGGLFLKRGRSAWVKKEKASLDVAAF